MTTYRIVIQGGEDAEGLNEARTTDDFDTAMDWITNAVEQVSDDENPLRLASLQVDGVEWVRAQEGGLLAPPDGGGEVIQLRAVG